VCDWSDVAVPASAMAVNGKASAFRLKSPDEAGQMEALAGPARLLLESTNSTDTVHGSDHLVLLQLQ